MRTWIDNQGCTGCGLCPQISPENYVLEEDGLAYVKDDVEGVKNNPGGPEGIANITPGTEDEAVEAMLECPTEVIWIEDEHGSGNFRNT